MRISLIAAMDENGGIGFQNKLLCHLPADLHYFKSLTIGKPIIMGRKTYESIGKPLPNRLNLVLTSQSISINQAQVYHSLETALDDIQDYQEVMIIGGEQLYKLTLPKAARLYLTVIHHQFLADVYFPQINFSEWTCIENTFRAKDQKNQYDLSFKIFDRI